jgi:ATP-binding cassette, subfamily B, bacterial
VTRANVQADGTPRGEPAPPPWHRRLTALRLVPRLMRMVWEAHPPFTAAMIALRTVQAAVPVTTLWVAKLIVDEVVRLTQSGGGTRHLWMLVGLEFAIVLVGEFLTRASALVESLLGDLFGIRVSIRIMEHAATLDLHQFENPRFYDHLERARRGTDSWLAVLRQVFAIGQDLLTLGALSVALAAHAPWLLLLLVVAVLPSFLSETHFAALSYSLLFRWTPERRKLDYVKLIGASDASAKEVQMFGLAPWLIARYRALAGRFYAANRELALRKIGASSALSVVGTAGYYGAYVIVLRRALLGTISIGTLTFLAASFQRSRTLVQSLLLSAAVVFEHALHLADLFAFFDLAPTIVSKPRARAVPRPIRRGLVFDDVGFRYAGSEQWAIRHVSFALRRGERVALVGENGAGKTTVTKLIARLYDPTEGRVLLDGVDLREYDVADLRRAIGVIFQDFGRYDLRFDENIGIGEVERVGAYLDAELTPPPPPPPAIVAATQRSLAAELLPRLPSAYRQMLGRRFDGGVDLSGGEWQKVALARAYMRDAQLLILDEPTAALDARAEYEVFRRFAALMGDRMAVVISHRFSTVRMADRIIVLRAGGIVEQGTHEQLVTAPGLYAELFALQAAGYR